MTHSDSNDSIPVCQLLRFPMVLLVDWRRNFLLVRM